MIKKTCKCGKTFFYYACNRVGKYCSKKCFYKYRPHITTTREFLKGNNNPLYGDKNHKWKGDKVGYFALHTWISRELGKPMNCWNCGTTKSKKFEWANISGKYKRHLKDWIRLCCSCHAKQDIHKHFSNGKHHNAILKKSDVIKIRVLFLTKNLSYKKIGEMFNVSGDCIRLIIIRKNWKHI